MITRRQLKQEQSRIRQLRKLGWTESQIKSWLRGWRQFDTKRARQ